MLEARDATARRRGTRARAAATATGAAEADIAKEDIVATDPGTGRAFVQWREARGDRSVTPSKIRNSSLRSEAGESPDDHGNHSL